MEEPGSICGKEYVMKRNLLMAALFMVGLCSLPAQGLDFMGAPCASLEKGQYSIGFNYSYSDMDIDIKGDYFGSYFGSVVKLPKEIKISKYYGVLDYGIQRDWNAYLMLGTPRLKAEIEHSGSVLVSCPPLLGIGTKVTFCEGPQYKWGGIAQLTYASGLDIEKHVPTTVGQSVYYHYVKGKLDFMEIQIAAGPTYTLNECISIYGGPFLHFISGDFKHKDYFAGTGPITDTTDDVREASWFGGYIGTRIELVKKMPISIEWQHTAFADAVGASILIRF